MNYKMIYTCKKSVGHYLVCFVSQKFEPSLLRRVTAYLLILEIMCSWRHGEDERESGSCGRYKFRFVSKHDLARYLYLTRTNNLSLSLLSLIHI